VKLETKKGGGVDRETYKSRFGVYKFTVFIKHNEEDSSFHLKDQSE